MSETFSAGTAYAPVSTVKVTNYKVEFVPKEGEPTEALQHDAQTFYNQVYHIMMSNGFHKKFKQIVFNFEQIV